ncbi:hypothetical protein BST92_07900 [Nonlabens arenilitoris]|uniref:Uncharacterized protein n=1 Tax=Nonlabens arenilitoris TaxID=1217969 RepID=A0A2S7UC39_9FLAO|nr:hypothetical protein BST92_07900 [Nonlabens arenilitoris]
MKKYFKFSPILFFGLCLILNSCSEEDNSKIEETRITNQFSIQKSSQQNSLIFSSFDAAMQAKLNDNPKLTKNYLKFLLIFM